MSRRAGRRAQRPRGRPCGWRGAERPVHAVVAILELEGAGVAGERDAAVVDGRDELVEARAVERAAVDDLSPSEVAGFDAAPPALEAFLRSALPGIFAPASSKKQASGRPSVQRLRGGAR